MNSSGLTTTSIVLDHTGHWLTDATVAGETLQSLGFTVTPFSEQQVPGSDGELISAGSGNLCVMLETGYLEFLTPLSDTPTGLELRRGIARYQGIHIAAFGVENARDWHDSREALGFPQSDVVDLSRRIDTATGHTRARFSVARPQPPGMPEGRFQALVHHTPDALWQPRWLQHRNTAKALIGMVVGVENLDEASARYARWFAREPERTESGAIFRLDHGDVVLIDDAARQSLFGDWQGIPAPGIVAPVIRVDEASMFKNLERTHGRDINVEWCVLPDTLGGLLGVVTGTATLADVLSGVA